MLERRVEGTFEKADEKGDATKILQVRVSLFFRLSLVDCGPDSTLNIYPVPLWVRV